MRRAGSSRRQSALVVLLAAAPAAAMHAPYVMRAQSPTAAVASPQSWHRRAPAAVLKQQQKKGGGKKKKEDDSPYRPSVSLPITDFSQRAMATKREPELQKFWEEEGIYKKLAESNPGEVFVLHDGPPYANGDLHIGHALNKILKDVINKYQMLRGRKVRYVPGWDCHGLPIELKVLQGMKSEERNALTPLTLREKAAGFAKETVEKQSASFQRYGVWGDFDKPYLTLQPEYEAAQIDVFGRMFLNGHIYRGRKPVNWSPSSRTALAEAELEYNDKHISRSIYVAFKVSQPTDVLKEYDDVRVVIWTTTPWTIPANLAVAVNSELEYSVVGHPSIPYKMVVAKDLISSLASRCEDLPEGESLEELATFKGKDLEGAMYEHPFAGRESKVVLGGDYITTESGTGMVHTAPGHGQDDYLTGLKYGLELLSPVNDAGCFTSEAGADLEGLSVLGDGNMKCIEKLRDSGCLVKEEAYEHKYPYDWRTKKPTIFRATSQWFASVDGFRDSALAAIDSVSWCPEIGRNRITAMTQSRSDWCISRQRTWGVPIPVFYHRDTAEVLLTESTLSHAKELIRKHGADIWWASDEKDLLPAEYADVADQYIKGTDTMDVWFDSGSSWAAVADQRDELRYPADLYLEGSDQHRGWFQSSLLTSVAVNGKAPYKQVLTHGFVLDEKGYKMSKSLGNVVDPLLVINGGKDLKAQPGYGADVLRLWVASVNYASDVCIGDGIIKQCFDSYRKLRNTARYLLGSLHDYVPEQHAVPYEELPSLDRYLLHVLDQFVAEATKAYDEYAFSRVYSLLQQFAVSDLSNFYLDVAKDRLYISSADEPRRRSCQTVMARVLEAFAAVLAPVLPHMAEDIWSNMPYQTEHKSIFQAGWPASGAASGGMDAAEVAEWEALRALRDTANKALERARNDKTIGASLEAKLYVHTDDATLQSALGKYTGGQGGSNDVDELRYILLVSGVSVCASADEAKASGHLAAETDDALKLTVALAPADGTKCERCWNYETSVGGSTRYPGTCTRCGAALLAMDFPEVTLKPPEAAAAPA